MNNGGHELAALLSKQYIAILARWNAEQAMGLADSGSMARS